jgi:hypothetical protein
MPADPHQPKSHFDRNGKSIRAPVSDKPGFKTTSGQAGNERLDPATMNTHHEMKGVSEISFDGLLFRIGIVGAIFSACTYMLRGGTNFETKWEFEWTKPRRFIT